MPDDKLPFWRTKTMAQMTSAEWESLCDGCGRCCLNKLEEEDTKRLFYTDVACRLFDEGTCRCKDYKHRKARVSDCLQLTPKRAAEYGWLPHSCAYRRLAEGRGLAWWHPLVSGRPETMMEAGVSVRGRRLQGRRPLLTLPLVGEGRPPEPPIFPRILHSPWPQRGRGGAFRRRLKRATLSPGPGAIRLRRHNPLI